MTNVPASTPADGGAPTSADAAPKSKDVFAKVRHHERAELLAAAREADVLPYFHVLTSPAMPVVEMEGAQRIMLGSNNYLGLTGDERVLAGAQDALHRYGTGLTGSRPLNGTTPLHLELEAELAEWMGSEDALVFTTGHQANLGTLGTILGVGDTVIADSGDHASILDGCLLSRAKLRPFRHNRLEKLEKMLARARGDGGGVLVVVDGVFSMEGDIAPAARHLRAVRAPRRAADGRRGPRRRGAGRARRRHRRAARPGGPRGSARGHLLEVAGLLRRLRGGARRRARVPALLLARVHLHRLRACPPRLAPRSPRCACCAHPMAPRCSHGCSTTRGACATGLAELGFAVVAPQRLPARPSVAGAAGVRPDPSGAPTIVTPIVPVLVGDDWKAALLWRALYDAGVFVNTALYPAVPPGGALLRTSVMATHDEATHRPRAGRVRAGQARLRGRARTVARPGARLGFLTGSVRKEKGRFLRTIFTERC